MTTAETTTTQTPETVQPQTPAPTDQETKQQEQPKPIPSPIEQVFLENQEEFQAAGLTAKALSVQERLHEWQLFIKREVCLIRKWELTVYFIM